MKLAFHLPFLLFRNYTSQCHHKPLLRLTTTLQHHQKWQSSSELRGYSVASKAWSITTSSPHPLEKSTTTVSVHLLRSSHFYSYVANPNPNPNWNSDSPVPSKLFRNSPPAKLIPHRPSSSSNSSSPSHPSHSSSPSPSASSSSRSSPRSSSRSSGSASRSSCSSLRSSSPSVSRSWSGSGLSVVSWLRDGCIMLCRLV